MPRKKAKPSIQAVVASLGLSALFLFLGVMAVDTLDISILTRKLIWPLLRLMGFICVGLAVGQIIEATGWTRFLAALAMPAFRFGHLGRQCSAAFTTAFFSGVAANAMLLEFYKEGKISRQQLFLSNFTNQLPGFFLHLPTTFFIVIPLTKWAGALYFIIVFLATLLRTSIFFVYGNLRLPPPQVDEGDVPAAINAAAGERKKPAAIIKTIKARLPLRIANIAIYVIPIYIMVFILNNMGLFDMARNWLAGYVTTSFLPIESLSLVVLSFTAEFTSGFAAAGALMDAGMLTIKQTVIALLLGNIIAFPIRALRHQLPHYMGIYSPKMGIQLLLIGQGFRIASLILAGVLFYFIV
jgi:hypothetical protein